MLWTQTESDQRQRVHLARSVDILLRLESLKRVRGGLVPSSSRMLGRQITLSRQRLLDLPIAVRRWPNCRLRHVTALFTGPFLRLPGVVAVGRRTAAAPGRAVAEGLRTALFFALETDFFFALGAVAPEAAPTIIPRATVKPRK